MHDAPFTNNKQKQTPPMYQQDRWFRDPSKPVPRNEITRFPHAVLEVKLQLTVRFFGGWDVYYLGRELLVYCCFLCSRVGGVRVYVSYIPTCESGLTQLAPLLAYPPPPPPNTQQDEAAKPQWVIDLLNSGIPREVHKFSKFIHGCAVLLSEEGA